MIDTVRVQRKKGSISVTINKGNNFFFHRRHPVKVPEIYVSSAISC